MQKIKEYILKTPEVKTLLFILSVVLSGVLCSAFITEITIEGKLVWMSFYKTTTFWIIIGYCLLLYLYNRFLYKFEKNILNYLDNDYCIAYIISECLPELVEKYKEDLKSGKNAEEFIDIKKELKKLKK
jgi:magnesium-transporting ATPase (P-type)